MQRAPPRVNDIEGIQVPQALDDLVARLLSKDPDDRPRSADQLRIELASLGLDPWTFEDARTWSETHSP